MKKNIFLSAALEELGESKSLSEVHHNETLQPKPGLDKHEFDENCEVTAEVGEEHPIAEHDEIDTVAESQEHTLALEHLSALVRRYSAHAAALETIQEQLEAKLENDEELSPADAVMIAGAVDAAGIGEPMATGIAQESFQFDARVATEGFVEELKDRVSKVWTAVAKFMKRVFEEARARMKRFADYFRALPGIVSALEKEIAQTEGFAGRPFENKKREEKIKKSFIAPASSKNPLDVVRGAMEEFDALSKVVDNRLRGDVQGLQRSWGSDDARGVVAQMNRVLNTIKQVLNQGSTNAKFSSMVCEVNLPEKFTLEGGNGMEGTKVVFNDAVSKFSSDLKIAGAKELAALRENAVRADRAMNSVLDDLFDNDFSFNFKSRNNFGELDEKQARDLVNKYRSLLQVTVDIWAGVILGAAHGLYYNFFATTGWVRASVQEARALKSQGQ